jgi:hypothetical protein
MWSAAFSVLGYVCWQSFDQAAEIARDSTLALVALLVAIVVVMLAYRTLGTGQARERLRRQLRRRWSRPATQMGGSPHSRAGPEPVRSERAQ